MLPGGSAPTGWHVWWIVLVWLKDQTTCQFRQSPLKYDPPPSCDYSHIIIIDGTMIIDFGFAHSAGRAGGQAHTSDCCFKSGTVGLTIANCAVGGGWADGITWSYHSHDRIIVMSPSPVAIFGESHNHSGGSNFCPSHPLTLLALDRLDCVGLT